MATQYGVTLQGFVRKRLPDIKAEIDQSIRDQFGDDAVSDPDGAFGRLSGMLAEREALLWELAQDVYDSQYRGTAEGVSLDNALELVGNKRLDEDFSKVWARFDGDDGSIISANRVVSLPSSGGQFENQEDVTIEIASMLKLVATIGAAGSYSLDLDGIIFTAVGGSAPLATEAIKDELNSGFAITDVDTSTRSVLVAGDQRASFPVGKGARIFGSTGNDGPYRVRARALETGSTRITFHEDLPDATIDGSIRKGITATTDLSVELTITVDVPPETTDASALAIEFAVDSEPSPGDFEITSVGSPGLLTAIEAGPLDVAADVELVIETGIAGWDGVTTVLAADVGAFVESDADARLRVDQSLRILGKATVEAIRARLLLVADVDFVTVIENDTDSVDADGRPPHSFEAIVEGGDPVEIAETIFNTKAAGIQTTGNTSEDVTDSQGIVHTIAFSRPVDIAIYVDVTVDATYGEETIPADAEDLIKQAVVDYGEALAGGKDVLAQRFLGPIFDAVEGLKELTVEVGTSPSPSGSEVAIAANERARFHVGRVTVTGL